MPSAIHHADQAPDSNVIERRLTLFAAVWEFGQDLAEVVNAHREESLVRDQLEDQLANF